MISKKINTLAVLTSGGDAPGMNAAIRAVVRGAAFYDKKIFGIYEGLQGLIDNRIEELTARSVKNILQRGGTILKSSRSEEFRTKDGRKRAFENLQNHGIDALVLIGGNGTFAGAHLFYEEFGLPVIGIPGTIDNDLYGTDFTLGYDTATQTVVDCVDKIRDTAESHNRLFFVEVMGRDSGFIALRAGLASGALDVVLPEETAPLEDLISELEKSQSNQKTNKLVLVSEGNALGETAEIAKKVKEKFPHLESKVIILGHLQRGGSPTIGDRVLASQLGVAAVEKLLAGKTDGMVGVVKNQIIFSPFKEAIEKRADLDENLLRISKILAT